MSDPADGVSDGAPATAQVDQLNRAIDALAMMGTATARMLQLEASSIPRLLAAAACRNLEIQLEQYERHKAAAAVGTFDWTQEDKRARMAAIVLSARDLVDTLTDALREAQAILDALGPKAPTH